MNVHPLDIKFREKLGLSVFIKWSVFLKGVLNLSTRSGGLISYNIVKLNVLLNELYI